MRRRLLAGLAAGGAGFVLGAAALVASGAMEPEVAVPLAAAVALVGAWAMTDSSAPDAGQPTPLALLPPELQRAAQADMQALQMPTLDDYLVWLLLERLEGQCRPRRPR